MKLLSNPNYTPDRLDTPKDAYRIARFIWDTSDCGDFY